ncbi:IcmC-like type IV secretion system protein [Xanthomonas campestris pv. trichodesmae]|uniref:IcmC-like type IV secretion system protein n=2 Tax=Xanthomonas citri TaxID=346 RepID=A0AB33CVE0_XANCI|nr:IcmC-like type IV secretion system protein [Xanthomonas citri]ASK94736.1 IcmC-like type IV secretion system protein [Xanthomonas citri pv. vignicola]MBV6782516.1 IcmC-like type IV secretion system protein [Xanthomonas campestris pv. trichodesmae]
MNDFSQMLGNFQEVAPYVSVLIQTIASFLGVVFIAQGLFKFRQHNVRGEAHLGSAFLYVLSGVALVNLALSTNAAFGLLYGNSGASVQHLVAYKPTASMPTQGAMLMKVIVLLLQVYGLFYTVTGWVQLRKLHDNRSGGEVSFKSTMFRILGGAALLNVVLTVNTLAKLLGFGRVL